MAKTDDLAEVIAETIEGFEHLPSHVQRALLRGESVTFGGEIYTDPASLSGAMDAAKAATVDGNTNVPVTGSGAIPLVEHPEFAEFAQGVRDDLAAKDDEITKRDARIAELEKDLEAATAPKPEAAPKDETPTTETATTTDKTKK